MKSPVHVFIALLFVVLFSLIAYRVSVHFAVLPGADVPAADAGAPARPAPAAPAPPTTPSPAVVEAQDALQRAAAVQSAVEAYHRDNGDWPQNLSQLGLGVPGDHAGGPVAAITVQPQGVVSVSLKPHVARGGVIRLTPADQPGGGVRWECRASSYPAATRLPDCR